MLAALRSYCRPSRELIVIFSCLVISIYFIIGTAPNISDAIENLSDVTVESIPPDLEHLTAKDAIWQTVAGTKHKFFVYSAYHEVREVGKQRRSVRVIATSHTKQSVKQRLWCRLWFGKEPLTSRSSLVAAKVQIIRENNRLEYSASFVLCPLSKAMGVPYSVSVVSDLYEPPTNQLIVHDNLLPQEKPLPLAVCVKPMYNFDKTLELIEFFELYRILGASYFTLYDHTTHPKVDCILRHYTGQRVVDVLPWQIDLRSQVDIRTENIFAALNDCLYRNMYRYSNVVMVDFDEFIIPRKEDTLLELINTLDKRPTYKNAGSYVFRNAFFYRQFPNDPSTVDNDEPLVNHLLTVTKTRRKSDLLPHRQRSKYICKPERVVEVGNHFIWEYLQGSKSINLGHNIALSHHYRVCEYGGDSCVNVTSLVDDVALRYRERLVVNVKRVWNEVKDSCDLLDFGVGDHL